MGFYKSGLFVTVLGVSAVVTAASSAPWEKSFDEWTDKDAQQIMTDSPWASEMPTPAAARPDIAVIEAPANGAAPATSQLGNPANMTPGVNISMSANTGSANSPDSGNPRAGQVQTPAAVAPSAPAPEPRHSIGIVWASAIPVRLAVLRLNSGGNMPSRDDVERVSKQRDNYVIAVIGMAAPDRDIDASSLAGKASLTVPEKPSVRATSCNYRKIGSADVYFFRFPRTALPISSRDRQVEFKVRFGQAEIKHRFEPKGMEYQGQLAL